MEATDLGQLERLDTQYEKQLQQCLQTKKHFEKMNDDYEALCVRLSTLTDKVSHEVMVPFGSLAFMPGKIVHTNEITVLLGDNWFVERSAKQALEIAKRRMITCTNMLKNLEKEEEQILKWIKYSKDVKGDENLIDIREDYDKEKEEIWRKEHRESVKRHKQASSKVSPKVDAQEDYLTKLDKLALEDDDDDDTNTIKPTLINFTHSNSSISNIKSKIEASSDNLPIQSPHDIYKIFSPVETTVKSILKRRNFRNEPQSKPQKNRVRFDDEVLAKPEREYTLAEPRKPVAFSGTIVEKNYTPVSENQRDTVVAFTGNVVEKGLSSTSTSLAEFSREENEEMPIPIPKTKSISKFKAQRITNQIRPKIDLEEDELSIPFPNSDSSKPPCEEDPKPKPNSTEIKLKTGFATVLEKAAMMEPIKPGDLKENNKNNYKKPVSKFKAQRKDKK